MSRSSAIEGHAGEADALVALGVDVPAVMKQAAAGRLQGFEDGVGGRQAADAAGIGLACDDPEVVVRASGLRVADEEVVLGVAVLQ